MAVRQPPSLDTESLSFRLNLIRKSHALYPRRRGPYLLLPRAVQRHRAVTRLLLRIFPLPGKCRRGPSARVGLVVVNTNTCFRLQRCDYAISWHRTGLESNRDKNSEVLGPVAEAARPGGVHSSHALSAEHVGL